MQRDAVPRWFESGQAVNAARNDYADALAPSNIVRITNVDFVDALIVCKAQFIIGEAYAGTYTFDRGALGIEGMLPL